MKNDGQPPAIASGFALTGQVNAKMAGNGRRDRRDLQFSNPPTASHWISHALWKNKITDPDHNGKHIYHTQQN